MGGVGAKWRFVGFTCTCVCARVCGDWIEGHGSPTTASRAVKQLHCWIPLMSFGLRITTTDAFGGMRICFQRSWSAVGADAEMAPKSNTNETFPDSCTAVFMRLTLRYDAQEV